MIWIAFIKGAATDDKFEFIVTVRMEKAFNPCALLWAMSIVVIMIRRIVKNDEKRFSPCKVVIAFLQDV